MRRVRHLASAAVALAACQASEPPRAPDLASYLYEVTRTDAARAVASWLLTRDEWNRAVVEPYRPLYDDYVRAMTAARPVLAAQLAKPHPIVARAHFAGDPAATHAQAITRWALPTLAPTRIAELAGRPPTAIDAVFVDAGGRWRAIVGLGAIVRARVAAIDPACAAAIDRIDPTGGACIEATWAVADAALRADRPRFTHACSLALNACR